MSQKIKWTVGFLGILLLLVGILFWQYQKNKTEKAKENQEQETLIKQNTESLPPQEEVNEPSIPEASQEEVTPQDDAKPSNAPQSKNAVTVDDCDNQCQDYSDVDTLKYCQSLCGLNGGSYGDKNCETLSGNEKDFCYKDEAVQKQDTEICAKIKDVKLKKTCEARIAEDLF